MSSHPSSSDNITRDAPHNTQCANHETSAEQTKKEQESTIPHNPEEQNTVPKDTVDGHETPKLPENHDTIADETTHPNPPKPNMTQLNSTETIHPASTNPDATLPEEIENSINAARRTMETFDQRLTNLEAGVEHLQQQLQDQAARTRQLEADVYRLMRTADSHQMSILQIFQRLEEWYWFN
ncbi:hypothetical protein ASPACDRAFT_56848 [Aspergillus aculeatus ATCC 16872]|uniref:Uncharacterized protein n=1 Tax=Aspergillus aculeatus (strain ATCC 16872 / CBS 172.66 / WB 5094) TaxID=690307 RepID=A0A1L9X532_ASPA1|nr:uncharacterized protein ASPACDRAFT_56848 [Aspergillus aculeatus ATCC 16872]OJK03439.1 hypothetical protein ASPACDRAFT_56848 [Aspergillus aculeatus ATCC 16872]